MLRLKQLHLGRGKGLEPVAQVEFCFKGFQGVVRAGFDDGVQVFYFAQSHDFFLRGHVNADFFSTLQKLQNVGKGSAAFSVPYHEAVVGVFSHFKVFGHVESVIPGDPFNGYVSRLPFAQVVPAAFSGAKDHHVFVTLFRKVILHGLVRAARVAHQNRETPAHDVVERLDGFGPKPPYSNGPAYENLGHVLHRLVVLFSEIRQFLLRIT